MGRKVKGSQMSLFLVIHAKGGESISPKQKDRTTTNFKILSFQLVSTFIYGFKDFSN
jgi:hypothetical protein